MTDRYSLIKYIGFALTLCAGIYPLIFEYHTQGTKPRKLTKHGIIGIVLVVVGSCASLFSAQMKEQSDSAEQQKHRDGEINSLRDVSSKLQESQRTTITVSTNLNTALKQLGTQSTTLGTVLGQAERNLHPLKQMRFSFDLVLPNGNLEIAQLRDQIASYLTPERIKQLTQGTLNGKS